MTVNMAVGYDGRQEIVQAVVAAIGESNGAELGQEAWHDLIARNLYTGGQHDPDLIIRTSGEHRLSGFLLWQSAWSELYFCDTPWPAFATRTSSPPWPLMQAVSAASANDAAHRFGSARMASRSILGGPYRARTTSAVAASRQLSRIRE